MSLALVSAPRTAPSPRATLALTRSASRLGPAGRTRPGRPRVARGTTIRTSWKRSPAGSTSSGVRAAPAGHVADRGGHRGRPGPADRAPASCSRWHELGYVAGQRRWLRAHPARARARHDVRSARWGCGRSPGRTWSGWSRAPTSRPRSPSWTGRTSSTWRASPCQDHALRVSIGTRFPAPQTSLGKVLLAAPDRSRGSTGPRPAEPLRASSPAGSRRGGARSGAARRAGQGLGADRRAAGRRGSARWPPHCATAPARSWPR